MISAARQPGLNVSKCTTNVPQLTVQAIYSISLIMQALVFTMYRRDPLTVGSGIFFSM